MFKLVLILLMPVGIFAQINSQYDEQNPVLTPEGNELYFTIANHPLNTAGVRDKGDVWMSRKENGKWTKPVRVNGLLNNSGYNAVLGFSETGDEMFVYGHYAANGDVAGSQGISVSQKKGSTWSLPRNETIPYFLNKSIGSGGAITPDKKVFVFSAESRAFDSFGNEDIYVSFNRDGVWTEPLNMGANINSENQELSPYYQSGSSTLFFSSNKPGGNGSFDVYQCNRLDDTWQNWSKPVNTDQVVNSEGRELYYRQIVGGYIFTTTHNSDGYGDVKEFHYPEPAQPDLQTKGIGVEEPIQVMRSDDTLSRVITLFGRVTDAKTDQAVVATISLKPRYMESIKSKPGGQYSAFLSADLDYSISIVAPGYVPFEEQIIVPDKNVRELEINFKLQPIAVGVSVNLKHVLFRQSSPQLLPESYDELDKVVTFLKENPSVEIELGGHTDNAGKASLNLKLSRERVNHVKQYLAERGINGSRIKTIGYGETRPLASNKTDEGRKMNRRVEFKVVKR